MLSVRGRIGCIGCLESNYTGNKPNLESSRFGAPRSAIREEKTSKKTKKTSLDFAWNRGGVAPWQT